MPAWWIKVDEDLRDDPKLWGMARKLGAQLEAAGHPVQPFNRLLATCAGAVVILWITAQRHIDEQDILPLGPADIDQLAGLEGFCHLMPPEWLEVLDANRVKLPGFQTHNGPSAKRRALTARRVQKNRGNPRRYK